MEWEHVLERVLRSPAEHFGSIDSDWAREILGCSAAEIKELSRVYHTSGRPYFDVFDIWNIGLYSGTGRSKPEREILYLSQLFDKMDWLEPAQYKISIEATCPRTNRCNSTKWQRPEILDAEWTDSKSSSGAVRWFATVSRRGVQTEIQAAKIRNIWHDALTQYRFHYTHPAIAASSAITRARGVGNCTGLSVLFAEILSNEGFQARTRCGFLWGGVAGMAHEWVEVIDADGAWKVIDPSMAALADDFFTPMYKQFCFGSMLNRVIPVAEHDATTVRHDCGDRVFTTYPAVRRATAPPAASTSSGPRGNRLIR